MGDLQAVATSGCDVGADNFKVHVPQIITFSGIDGAGKTTQISSLSAYLSKRGYRVAEVRFWDDVAVLSKLRAGVSLTLLRKDATTTDNASLRNDKNVRTWYLMLARSGFYLLDALSLRRVVSRLRNSGQFEFIIFDRYLYDQLVQIRPRHWLARAYIRLLLSLAPTPEFPFILDASPEEAFARKPEYPLDFMRGYRRSYLELREFVSHLAVIDPSTMENVQHLIVQKIAEGSSLHPNRSRLA
jgi:thymidylate kinase